jgi:hypothetical protein
MKLYLDVSCLNRPFDDQKQSRIRLESEAVTLILEGIDAGTWEETSSRMVEMEISVIPDETRRRRVLELVPRGRIELAAAVFDRAKELLRLRLRGCRRGPSCCRRTSGCRCHAEL